MVTSVWIMKPEQTHVSSAEMKVNSMCSETHLPLRGVTRRYEVFRRDERELDQDATLQPKMWRSVA